MGVFLQQEVGQDRDCLSSADLKNTALAPYPLMGCVWGAKDGKLAEDIAKYECGRWDKCSGGVKYDAQPFGDVYVAFQGVNTESISWKPKGEPWETYPNGDARCALHGFA